LINQRQCAAASTAGCSDGYLAPLLTPLLNPPTVNPRHCFRRRHCRMYAALHALHWPLWPPRQCLPRENAVSGLTRPHVEHRLTARVGMEAHPGGGRHARSIKGWRAPFWAPSRRDFGAAGTVTPCGTTR